MKKRMVNAIIAVIAIGIMGFAYIYTYTAKIGTKYATEYAKTIGSYDIKLVDQFLEEDTMITYKGQTDTYKNLRANVVDAFEAQEFIMAQGDSYGHGNGGFAKLTQTIGIQTYVNSQTYSSEFVSMEIKRNWFLHYEVETLTSDDDFFGYLFFGIRK